MLRFIYLDSKNEFFDFLCIESLPDRWPDSLICLLQPPSTLLTASGILPHHFCLSRGASRPLVLVVPLVSRARPSSVSSALLHHLVLWSAYVPLVLCSDCAAAGGDLLRDCTVLVLP